MWSFSCTLPLSAIFSFCSDYDKVIFGLQHRITMTRNSNNSQALYRTNAAPGAVGIYPDLDAAS